MEAPAQDDLARQLRGFGPIGLLAIIIILIPLLVWSPISAGLVLLWAQRSNTPLGDIGYVRPRSWLGELAIGAAFGVALKLLVKAVAMPLLGGATSNFAYHYLAGNTAALPGTVFTMIVVGGFAEETVFRGYLFERLGRLFGPRPWAKPLIVLITAGVFASLHLADQGIAGVEQAAMTGLAFGTVYAVTGRLWAVMCAHAAYDLFAVAIIYANAESAVSHLVFR